MKISRISLFLALTLATAPLAQAKSPKSAKPAKMAVTAVSANTANAPKRDFRGAWLHTVYQPQYAAQSTEQNKAYLIRVLDSLQAVGVNAVIFQVRPSADAFYKSKHEPWSRFLTKDGNAPQPYWDPLAFVTEEAHKRNMELHAWLNPYRVTTSKNEKLAKGHIYHKHPERFVSYEGKMYFDPALVENQDFIVEVVKDIVGNYDIDAIHFDDYFYPYPGKTDFPDNASYKKYGNGRDRGDWRRANVDSLIKKVNVAIKAEKPWVRFGISPFGIWRNAKSDPKGSATNGLQNYDDLYADVLLWAREGWIDYLAPQLYWALENPRASYSVLAEWWDKNTPDETHLYIGQDIGVTMAKPDTIVFDQPTQLKAKLDMASKAKNIDGNIWWPGYSIIANKGGVADSLARVHYTLPALPPAYPGLSSVTPEAPSKVKYDGKKITWSVPAPEGQSFDAQQFVIYRFEPGEDSFYLENPANIAGITRNREFHPTHPGVYVITALDRVNNESLPSAPVKVK